MAGTHAIDRPNVLVAALLTSTKSRRFHVLLLALSFAMMFAEGYDMQVLAYAAPLIIKDWNIAHGGLGPVFGAGLFGYMVGATALTGVADRIGRKKMVVVGTAWFGLWTLLMAFSSSIETLLLFRALAGVGLGVAIPTIVALNAEFAPASSRAARLTFLFVGYALGGSIGGMLAAPAMAAWGWEFSFYLGGFAPLALAAILAIYLPESLQFLLARNAGPERVRATLRRVDSDSTLRGDEPELYEGRVQEEQGLPAKLLFTQGRSKLTLLLWSAFIMSLLGHHFLTSWLPTILEREGIEFQQAVVIGGMVMAGACVGGPLIGLIVDRLGTTALAAAYFLSAPLVAAIGLFEMPRLVLGIVVFLAGATLVGGQMGINAMAATVYPTTIRSTGAGWALGIGRIGAILGPVIGGVLLSNHVPLGTIFLLAALPALICGGLLLAITSHRKSLA